jgi:hypothetical protein
VNWKIIQNQRTVVFMTRKTADRGKEPLPEIEDEDKDWITPEVAGEVLRRANDGSKPIPWSQVEAELEEMDRLGI